MESNFVKPAKKSVGKKRKRKEKKEKKSRKRQKSEKKEKVKTMDEYFKTGESLQVNQSKNTNAESAPLCEISPPVFQDNVEMK